MTHLDLLNTLEEIQRLAQTALEAAYADLNAEAAEMEAAFNEAVKPPKIKEAPRDARELGSMEDVLSYMKHR